jgi:Probable Zinc-ribbon domain
MAVRLRTRKASSGCPYCAGKRVLPQDSLAARCPSLAHEWHTQKNGELAPDAVTVGSNRRVWWICRACGHEWAAPIVRRTQSGTTCPGCAGQVVTPGRSFADLFPELAREWHTDKNGELTAHGVTAHSGRRVWWRCGNCGRQWQAAVNDRAAGKGCSTCRPPGWSQVAIRLGAELATLLPVGPRTRTTGGKGRDRLGTGHRTSRNENPTAPGDIADPARLPPTHRPQEQSEGGTQGNRLALADTP